MRRAAHGAVKPLSASRVRKFVDALLVSRGDGTFAASAVDMSVLDAFRQRDGDDELRMAWSEATAHLVEMELSQQALVGVKRAARFQGRVVGFDTERDTGVLQSMAKAH